MSDKEAKKVVPVEIKIMDREYMVSCPVGEQSSLIASAKQLDEKMRIIRRSGKIIGSERIAVITALNLANELMGITNQIQCIEKEVVTRIDRLQQKVDITLERIDDGKMQQNQPQD
ncbi:MAG: cell division protein ZapA [Cocleimonas sp.]|nr:cell division protein ZapA [Cocleimonas sp.]